MARFSNISAGVLAFLAIAGLAALALAVSRANWGGEVARDDAGIVGTPIPATIDHDAFIEEIPNPARPMPKLTESRLDDIRAAVNSDERLKGLLNGVSFTITSIGPWVTGKKERELIGALVIGEPGAPLSYDGTLPSVGFENPPDKPELYTPGGSYSIQARGIEELTLMVDLHKREVVSIEVSKAAEINYRYDIMDVIRYIISGGPLSGE